MSDTKHYDVMILGSGLGGSMLGAILAKGGLSVLMLEVFYRYMPTNKT